MQRRTVLAALGTGTVSLAGCLGLGPGEADPAEPRSTTRSPGEVSDRSTTATPPRTAGAGGLPRQVSVAGVADGGLREAVGVGADVTVRDATITAADTAVLEVALTTVDGGAHTLTYTRDTCDLNLLRGTHRRLDDVRLLLIPTAQEWESVAAECWVPDNRNLACGVPARDAAVTVAPGDPVRWRFRLWADPETVSETGCLPPGQYRLTRAFSCDGTEATLGITLALAAA